MKGSVVIQGGMNLAKHTKQNNARQELAKQLYVALIGAGASVKDDTYRCPAPNVAEDIAEHSVLLSHTFFEAWEIDARSTRARPHPKRLVRRHGRSKSP